MKFLLKVNDSQQEGFHLSVSAEKENELKIAQDLTQKLIEKISVIEVKIQQDESY